MDKVGFTNIELDGLRVALGFYNGPGLLLPANEETVRDVLTFLDKKYATLLAAGRDINGKRLAARKDGPHELLSTVRPCECPNGKRAQALKLGDTTSESDTNKIRFDFGRGAFKVMYLDGGSLKRVTKGFDVPRTDVVGLVLCRADYAKMKAGILNKARMAWNKLDQSGAPRLQDHTSSDVAAACSHDGGLQPADNEGKS